MQRLNVNAFSKRYLSCFGASKKALVFNNSLKVSSICCPYSRLSQNGLGRRTFATRAGGDEDEQFTPQESKVRAMMKHLKHDRVEDIEREYANLLKVLNTPTEVPSEVPKFFKGNPFNEDGVEEEEEEQGQEEEMPHEEFDEETETQNILQEGKINKHLSSILSAEEKKISNLGPEGRSTLKRIFCCYDLKEAVENLHFHCIQRISSIFDQYQNQKIDESIPHFAIRIGSFKGFSGLVSRGYDIHSRTSDGETLLHYACLPQIEQNPEQDDEPPQKTTDGNNKNPLRDLKMGPMFFNIEDSLKAASILLSNGINVNATTSHGDTALTIAITRGPEAVKLVELLLRFGADPNLKTVHGTPIEIAMEGMHLETLDLLLKYKADVIIDDFSAFHLAAVVGSPSILRVMLKHDLTHIAFGDPRGNTPLHLVPQSSAKGVRRRKCVNLLVRAAGDRLLNSRNFSGSTPLHMAAMKGDLDVVEELLACGANPEILDNQNRASPLMIAATAGFPDIVRTLFKAKVSVGDRAGIGAINESGHNALHFACASSNLECLKILAVDENGDITPSIHLLSKEGHTPLSIAMAKGRKEIGEFLLDRCGVKVDQPDSIDNTPLYYASIEGFNDCIQLLLDHGANPDFRNVHGETPLLVVFKKLTYNSKFHECAVTLIKSGADVNVVDNFGQTPLHTAAKEGLLNWIKLLVSKGADLTIKDEDGKTPYDLAIESGNVKCGNFLK